MASALDALMEEINSVEEQDYINPLEEMEEGGRAVGDMTHKMLQLFTMWQRWEEKAERLTIDAKYARNKEQKDAMIPGVELAHRRANIVKELFWLEVHTGFPLPGDGAVTVCIGRKVIHCKSRENPLRGLFQMRN